MKEGLSKVSDYIRDWLTPFLALIATLLFVGGLWLKFKDGINWIDVATLWGVAFTVLSISYVAREIANSVEQEKFSIEQKKAEVALTFLTTFFGYDFQEMVVNIRILLRKANIFENSAEKDKALELLHGKERGHLISVLNFFESMAVYYMQDRVDRRIIQEAFTSLSIDIYNHAKPIYIDVEKANQPTVYGNFYAMQLDLQRKKHSIRRDNQPPEPESVNIDLKT